MERNQDANAEIRKLREDLRVEKALGKRRERQFDKVLVAQRRLENEINGLRQQLAGCEATMRKTELEIERERGYRLVDLHKLDEEEKQKAALSVQFLNLAEMSEGLKMKTATLEADTGMLRTSNERLMTQIKFLTNELEQKDRHLVTERTRSRRQAQKLVAYHVKVDEMLMERKLVDEKLSKLRSISASFLSKNSDRALFLSDVKENRILKEFRRNRSSSKPIASLGSCIARDLRVQATYKVIDFKSFKPMKESEKHQLGEHFLKEVHLIRRRKTTRCLKSVRNGVSVKQVVVMKQGGTIEADDCVTSKKVLLFREIREQLHQRRDSSKKEISLSHS